MAIVIFRTCREVEDEHICTRLHEELQAGRLRQGWGCAGMTLLNEQGNLIPQNMWEANYRTSRPCWGCPSPNRYTILTRMLEFGRGDVVIAPNMPADGRFCVACVPANEPYSFETPDWADDFGHVIRVDGDSVETYANGQNEHTRIISGQRGYRDAVNIVRDDSIEARLNEALAGLGFEHPA